MTTLGNRISINSKLISPTYAHTNQTWQRNSEAN